MTSSSLDDEWRSYLNQTHRPVAGNRDVNMCSLGGGDPTKDPHSPSMFPEFAPKEMELTISTKTKVLFLNQPVDIQDIFWRIPVLEYWKPETGVLKKQMKIVSKTEEEYAEYEKRLVGIPYYQENIIKQIHNPTARTIKFKDERKITVGVSKKDIITYRGKVKNAFYNCFALVMRFRYDDETAPDGTVITGDFKEVHIKVFNTGKMEIPGIVNYKIMEHVKVMIMNLLTPYLKQPLEFVENSLKDHVLINSNFNCGFFVHRERLHHILSSDKYGIEAAYDPCSYPGVKCKYYFNNDLGLDAATQTGKIQAEHRAFKLSELVDSRNYTEVSFMIFRTGSCLIVGNCTEKILRFVFDYIRNMLVEEYPHIRILSENPVIKNKKPKLRKRTATFTYNPNAYM